MKKYQLRHYEVVAGEVNDTYVWGEIEIPTTKEVFNKDTDQEFSTDDPTDQQIWQALKDCGFMNKFARKNSIDIDVNGDVDAGFYISIASNGQPFCELRLVDADN